EILGADYSLVCMSGYGIISGYTDTGEKLADKIIPPLYGTLGRSYAHFDGLYSPESFVWDVSEFRPDTVVINLGTNDMSYCKDDPDKRAEFTEQYAAFLRAVRAKNPDAIIVCTLGIMGTDLNQSMQQAVINYKNESGDGNVYVMFFPMQDEADGLAVDWHPSPMTHEKAAGKLAAFLKSLWEE
ncbi:MAG: GDSL family lipase, partial [Lachnospiraceae bacterium]|nr:GDSL family lipase [Lachnospiraceae bacterium]